MLRVRLVVAVCGGLLESCTWIVAVVVTAALGVPLITPLVEASDRPAGSEPPVTDQLYGGVPPAAPRAAEYGAPTCPVVSDGGESMSGGAEELDDELEEDEEELDDEDEDDDEEEELDLPEELEFPDELDAEEELEPEGELVADEELDIKDDVDAAEELEDVEEVLPEEETEDPDETLDPDEALAWEDELDPPVTVGSTERLQPVSSRTQRSVSPASRH